MRLYREEHALSFSAEKYVLLAMEWEEAHKADSSLTQAEFSKPRGVCRQTLVRALNYYRTELVNLSDSSKLKAEIAALGDHIQQNEKLAGKLLRDINRARRQKVSSTDDLRSYNALSVNILAWRTRRLELEGLYGKVLKIKLDAADDFPAVMAAAYEQRKQNIADASG